SADRGPAEHRQYRRVCDEADRRHAVESGSGQAEVVDRYQLQPRCRPFRPRLIDRTECAAMADLWSIISTNYKTVGLTVPSKTPYVAVDPTLYEGGWTGKYPDNKTFKFTISNVTGFRAKVQYQSAGTNKFQEVLIKDN